jgi:hypothetical protein
LLKYNKINFYFLNFHKSFYAGDKIFVRDVGTGLFCIEDNVMVYINGSEVFADQRVDFIEKSNKAENEYILASREKGLIRFQLINENPKDGADNKLIAFVQPKDTNGVLIELCQEKP